PRPPATPPRTGEGVELLALGEKLAAAMGLALECSVVESGEDLYLGFWGPDERLAIGSQGEVLDALQYIVNRIVARVHTQGERRVVVDSGGYRRRHDREIEERARKTALRVRQTGEAVQFEP